MEIVWLFTLGLIAMNGSGAILIYTISKSVPTLTVKPVLVLCMLGSVVWVIYGGIIAGFALIDHIEKQESACQQTP